MRIFPQKSCLITDIGGTWLEYAINVRSVGNSGGHPHQSLEQAAFDKHLKNLIKTEQTQEETDSFIANYSSDISPMSLIRQPH